MLRSIIPLFLLMFIAFCGNAQPYVPTDEPYGKIDNADLELKSCDFEKGANSEILISKADLSYDNTFKINIKYHVRIKIFNDNGKYVANIHLPYFNYRNEEYITGVQGETINLTGGKDEITPVEKNQVFTQVIDKYFSETAFSFPNVRAGSIIEYEYTLVSENFFFIPTWYFQDDNSPVRYSEIDTHIPEYFDFSVKTNIVKPFAVDTMMHESGRVNIIRQRKVMIDMPSLPNEPYMSSVYDNLQSIHFQLTTIRPFYGFSRDFFNTWKKVGDFLYSYDDFGMQLKRSLKDEEPIINSAKALKTNDEKIAFLFKTVQNDMKWNGRDEWFTVDGTVNAWDKKTGNSTEVNLILYHLLKRAGINAMPMVVSTRGNGKVNPAFTNFSQFNRTVVYIPVDSTKKYVLDATNKYNMYNSIPFELLNSSGLYLDKDNESCDILFLDNEQPMRRSVFIKAVIAPDGKINGTAQINSLGENRVKDISRYKKDGEKKYMDSLADGDNNLKITALKMNNLTVDTLPLVQDVDFGYDPGAQDANYIYFNPAMFSNMRSNPFIAEDRVTDIDLGYLNDLTLNGVYQIPEGYKSETLPKSLTMSMPDNSITFKRFVGEEEGKIEVRYTIIYRKTIYFKENYADFHVFFKKMYEMMNEQIALKKS